MRERERERERERVSEREQRRKVFFIWSHVALNIVFDVLDQFEAEAFMSCPIFIRRRWRNFNVNEKTLHQQCHPKGLKDRRRTFIFNFL